MNRPLRLAWLAVCCPALALLTGSALRAEEPASNLESEHDQVLYVVGTLLGQQIKALSLSPHEVKVLEIGIEDAALERELRVDRAKIQEAVDEFHQVRFAKLAAKERKAGAAFIEKALSEDGAIRTASGMVIREIEAGTGDSPRASSVVKVDYEGHLRDGTIFDSSMVRGEPMTFPLDRVIPCWQEGLKRMKVGGTSELVCPSSLAYGERGSPPMIPPGATLVFGIKLVEIVEIVE